MQLHEHVFLGESFMSHSVQRLNLTQRLKPSIWLRRILFFKKKNASLLVSVRCFQNKNLGFRIHSQIKRQSFRRNDCNTFVTQFIFFAVSIYSRNSTSANSVLANKKWCGIGETLFESSKSLSKISKHLVSLRGSLKVNKHLFQFTISCFCLYHLTWYKVSRRSF